MAARLIVLVVLALIAVAVALLAQRRRPDPPSAPSYRGPSQLDRDDFDNPTTPFLAVVFASSTCNTCPEVWAMLEPLRTNQLSVQRADVQDRSELHKRYRIDGVPTTVIADSDGVVSHTFFGPVPVEELRGALSAAGVDLAEP